MSKFFLSISLRNSCFETSVVMNVDPVCNNSFVLIDLLPLIKVSGMIWRKIEGDVLDTATNALIFS